MSQGPWETPRLLLRHFTLDDGEFVLRLLNEPSFHEYIGDKGVRTLEGAHEYLRRGPMTSYEQHGHGLNLVVLRETGTPIGMCGLLKRDALEAPDIGYAFVPEHWGVGHAVEAAQAVLASAWQEFGLSRVFAITNDHNDPSQRLLLKLGFVEEAPRVMKEGAPPVRTFAKARPTD
ncbi:MAG: GNAT family N-acetyltransferase [Gemmatimonadales bacterium]|nr:GNAT family N-acetyltransferase [Gemmatimonadales bacterium]